MKTQQLGSAIIPLPVNASGIAVVPPSPFTEGNLQDLIDAIIAAIAALTPGTLVLQEEDGSPTVSVLEIDVPNGTLDVVSSAGTLNYIGSRNRREVLRTVAAAGASITLDWSAYNSFDITLTAACVISFSNVPASGADAHITVVLRQGGTGSYTVTWPASVKWQDLTDGTDAGSAPTLWTAVDAQDDFEFSSSDGGTTVGGSMTAHPAAAYTLTVDDEGTPLATGATSLDFVGAGVTASGATAAKTITIPGGATASDSGIWRPLMDSGSGMIITDGATGEATMGFGAA